MCSEILSNLIQSVKGVCFPRSTSQECGSNKATAGCATVPPLTFFFFNIEEKHMTQILRYQSVLFQIWSCGS